MSLFEEHIAKYNNWTMEYCRQVIQEYERFLSLKANNNIELSPSDDIDKLWHFHILCTELYNSYCIEKFGKIIQHNPIDSTDQQKRKQRLINTLNCYKQTYQLFINKKVWNVKLDLEIDEVEKLQLLQVEQIHPYVSYVQNKPNNDQIKIYICYLNRPMQLLQVEPMQLSQVQNQQVEPMQLATQVQNQQVEQTYPYNKQIISLNPSPTDTINSLKDIIVTNLNVKKEQINIKVHPEIPQYLYLSHVSFVTKQLNDNTLMKNLQNIKCDFFIVEINELNNYTNGQNPIQYL